MHRPPVATSFRVPNCSPPEDHMQRGFHHDGQHTGTSSRPSRRLHHDRPLGGVASEQLVYIQSDFRRKLTVVIALQLAVNALGVASREWWDAGVVDTLVVHNVIVLVVLCVALVVSLALLLCERDIAPQNWSLHAVVTLLLIVGRAAIDVAHEFAPRVRQRRVLLARHSRDDRHSCMDATGVFAGIAWSTGIQDMLLDSLPISNAIQLVVISWICFQIPQPPIEAPRLRRGPGRALPHGGRGGDRGACVHALFVHFFHVGFGCFPCSQCCLLVVPSSPSPREPPTSTRNVSRCSSVHPARKHKTRHGLTWNVRMPLLPLRALPVNDAPAGSLLTMRVDVRPTGSAYVYVRRETDKKTWICKVRTLQEILAPSQQARELDLMAVITCLYNGVAYDTLSAPAYTHVPLELRRREVAFSQPETWTDGGYRLTMRVAVRSLAMATALEHLADTNGAHDGVAAAIPVAEFAEDDVVFGLNFSVSDVNLDHAEPRTGDEKTQSVCLRSVGAAFPGSYLNFDELKDQSLARVVRDGVRVIYEGYRARSANDVVVTLDILHAKDPVLFTFSVNSQAVKVLHSTSYQQYPGGDLFHTITQYAFKVTAKSLLQVVLLPGSACALEGSSLTIRDTEQT